MPHDDFEQYDRPWGGVLVGAIVMGLSALGVVAALLWAVRK